MKKFRGVFIKNSKEVDLIRKANKIVAEILTRLGKAVEPGVSTSVFEKIASDGCDEYHVKPAFKGYQGFPYALCCSVNEEVVHGFPTDRILSEGDIVSFDFGVVYKGFYGDSARTFGVGQITDEVQKLLTVTKSSLLKGIEHAVVGNNLYDVSAAIQQEVETNGFGVVKRFVGHGIGKNLHEKPEVPNFVPKGLHGVPLKAGMTLAIEPMVTIGDPEVSIQPDRWTVVTKDKSWSAHFEHTIAITPDGPEILSVVDGENP